MRKHYHYNKQSITALTETIYELILTPDENTYCNFKPGQYCSVQIDQKKKYFSIANAPAESNRLELHIRIPSHRKEELVWLEEAEEILVEGPWGAAYRALESTASKLLIAEGIGITPFLSIIASAPINSRYDLLWLIKDESDLYCYQQLKKTLMALHHKNTIHVISMTDVHLVEEIARLFTGFPFEGILASCSKQLCDWLCEQSLSVPIYSDSLRGGVFQPLEYVS